jgi:hypothetical protein
MTEFIPEAIKAPWTAEQVASLNCYQQSRVMHPFTCGAEGCRHDLVATAGGWTCPDSGCPYAQDWAHDFMANWSWLVAFLGNNLHRLSLDQKLQIMQTIASTKGK